MWNATVKDLSAVMRTTLRKPIPKSSAQLEDKCARLLEAFPNHVTHRDISLNANDELFGYMLQVQMFGGDVRLNVNAATVELHCAHLKSKEALQAAAEVMIGISELFCPDSAAASDLVFALHAAFQDANAYADYMKPYADADKGIEAGGKSVFGEGRTFTGKAHLITEKSAAIESAVFVSFTAFTSEKVQPELFQKIEARFTELAETCKLSIVWA